MSLNYKNAMKLHSQSQNDFIFQFDNVLFQLHLANAVRKMKKIDVTAFIENAFKVKRDMRCLSSVRAYFSRNEIPMAWTQMNLKR